MFVGCLLYADDIILLSPTVGGLQAMLDKCFEISCVLSLKFNVCKSHCMIIGKIYKTMLRKIKFYRHLHLSKNFLANLFCVCLMHTADDCVKSVFLPEHVATETVTLSFLSYVYD